MKSPSPLRRRYLRSLTARATALALAGCSAAALAQPVLPQPESAVKAAFLYRFGAYVEWPAGLFKGPADPLVIGVAGNDAVASDLEQLVQGRSVDGRPVQARRVRDAAGAGAAHILLVGNGAGPELLPPPEQPVLLVTERAGPPPQGSVVQFMTEGGRVRFSVALDAAEARSLRLSARLLAVAQAVTGKNR